MAFPPVPFQEWFLRQTSTGNAALNAYVARVKADGGVVEAIGCVSLAVWDWVAPVAPTLLLDLFPNAAAAYSLRKLRAAYSGSAVRVRRSSDNTEQDIGFTAQGELDTASLLSFVNADVNTYTSDFSSTEDLNESNGTGAAAQSVGGVDDAYKFTLSGGAVSHFPRVLGALNTSDTFNISFDFYIPSSNSSCDGIQLYLLAGAPLYNTLDAWTSVSLTNVTSTSDQLRFYATDGGSLTVDGDGDVFYLKNIVITQTTADGLVSTWYDQSLSNDATQSTAAAQPKIVSAGSLVTEGTSAKPAIDFDGVDDYFSRTAINIDANSNISCAAVVQNDGGAGVIFTNDLAANAYFFGFTSNASNEQGAFFQSATSGGIIDKSGTASTSQLLMYADFQVTSLSYYEDGGIESGTSAFVTLNTSTFEIGARSGNTFFDGGIQEIIIFNSDQSANRTGIETNINDFYSIF